MNEVDPPRRKKQGIMCPLYRKDVSEVCHTCDWYRPLPLEELLANGGRRELMPDWGCTMTHLLKVTRDLMGGIDGTQRAIEIFRNNVDAANHLTLTMQVREARRMLESEQPQPPAEPKLINGGD